MYTDENLWRALDEVCEGSYLAKEFEGAPVDDVRRKWIRAMHVAFAVRAKQYEVVAPLLKQTDETPESDAALELAREFSPLAVKGGRA